MKMKTLLRLRHPAVSTVLLVLTLTGCGHKTAPPVTLSEDSPPPLHAASPDPLALALAPHDGDGPLDKEIRRFQEQVRDGQNRNAALERLGWAFVAKARGSFDSGFYKLAEACANVLDSESPGCPEALLLRGHVFQNLHRFKEAELLARELVARCGLSFDFGLLGDTLMEQGRIKEAVTAYQSMVDIRPDLQSYSRIAHVRWLTGDLEGAIEMMKAAASASSSTDADSAAWVHSRLAALELQADETKEARRNCEAALELRPDYPPALLFRGKMLLAGDDTDAAITDLERAAQQNPLPEYQWTLAEALRAAGREPEAEELESRLSRHGATDDPRTYSLYLATRGKDAGLAVRLATCELEQRKDVFTHDALAWALAAAGQIEEASVHMDRALAEGTQDARLFFHGAAIATRAGRTEDAMKWFARATAMMDLLLPSERDQLLKLPASLAGSDDQTKTDLPPSAAADSSTSAFAAEGK
jgi:tetratricopeptide (TPR) repeat protein